jgi:hypothetical protein
MQGYAEGGSVEEAGKNALRQAYMDKTLDKTGPFTGGYDDSPTLSQRERTRANGNWGSDLPRYSQQMEKNLDNSEADLPIATSATTGPVHPSVGSYDQGGAIPDPNSDPSEDGGPSGDTNQYSDALSTVMDTLAYGRQKNGLGQQSQGSQGAQGAESADDDQQTQGFDDGGSVDDPVAQMQDSANDESKAFDSAPTPPAATDTPPPAASAPPAQGAVPSPETEPSFDPGSTTPDTGKGAASIVGYLKGAEAAPPQVAAQSEQQVDPQGQMPEDLRKLMAIANAPDDDSKWGIMQSFRQKYDHFKAFAAAAATGIQGKAANLAAAAKAATQAYANVPDGNTIAFEQSPTGVTATVTQGGTPKASPIPLSTQQFVQFLRGVPGQFDTLMDSDVVKVLKSVAGSAATSAAGQAQTGNPLQNGTPAAPQWATDSQRTGGGPSVGSTANATVNPPGGIPTTPAPAPDAGSPPAYWGSAQKRTPPPPVAKTTPPTAPQWATATQGVGPGPSVTSTGEATVNPPGGIPTTPEPGAFWGNPPPVHLPPGYTRAPNVMPSPQTRAPITAAPAASAAPPAPGRALAAPTPPPPPVQLPRGYTRGTANPGFAPGAPPAAANPQAPKSPITNYVDNFSNPSQHPRPAAPAQAPTRATPQTPFDQDIVDRANYIYGAWRSNPKQSQARAAYIMRQQDIRDGVANTPQRAPRTSVTTSPEYNQSYMERKYDNLAAQLNADGTPKYSPQQLSVVRQRFHLPPDAGATPATSDEPPVPGARKFKGQWYTRGPNGEAVPYSAQ